MSLQSKLMLAACFSGEASWIYVRGSRALASISKLQRERRLRTSCIGAFSPFDDGSSGRCSNSDATISQQHQSKKSKVLTHRRKKKASGLVPDGRNIRHAAGESAMVDVRHS